MEILKEVCFLLEKNKIKQIDVLGNSNSATRYTEFYELIRQGKFKTDQDAAAYFYNSTPDDANYKKFKADFKNRLYNTIFFIDVKQPNFNDVQRAYYTCWKNWAAVRIMMGRMAHKAATELARDILEYAIKFEFTDLVVEASRHLRHQSATVLGDRQKFNFFRDLYTHWKNIQDAERITEELSDEIRLAYVHSKATKREMLPLAEANFQQIKPYLERYDSYYLHLTGRALDLSRCLVANDYKAAEGVCRDALDYFNSKPFDVKSAKSVFWNQLTIIYMMQGKYDEAEQAAQNSLALQDEGSYNWFRLMELYIQLCFYKREYTSAHTLYRQVVEHKNFQFQHLHKQEDWKIVEAHLVFLLRIGKLTLPETECKRYKSFKLAKFINEVPIFSQDKRGMNVPILIAQIIHLIADGMYETLIDRIEALDKYRSRYLKDEDMFRCNCFMRMLTEIAKAGFYRVDSAQRCARFVEDLQSTPPDVSGQAHDIEIIPYEHLWEYLIELLPAKPYYQLDLATGKRSPRETIS